MIPNMEAAVISQSVEVKPDSDGEERLLIADMVLEVDMKLYREEEHEVILDVYTPLRQCIPKGKTEALESLLIRNFSKCRLSDRIEMKETRGKILQICHSQGQVKVDKTRIVEGGVQVDGIVQLKILYIVGYPPSHILYIDYITPWKQDHEPKPQILEVQFYGYITLNTRNIYNNIFFAIFYLT